MSIRRNLTQLGKKGQDGRGYIPDDWYPGGIPANVFTEQDVYLDTAYSFAAFHSHLDQGMQIGRGTGCYDRATFLTGSAGRIEVGRFVILNGTTLISQTCITIGDHCMLAWGSVLCDTFWSLPNQIPVVIRRKMMERVAEDPLRQFPSLGPSAPIVLESNCWVGFDAVILPGVHLGQGCIVGSKTLVREDVPPYAVLAGNPARVIRYLKPDDTPEMRKAAYAYYLQT